MSLCTLVISCLTTSNLPWFMDLTFQVPMQYCSLHYQTLLPSPVTSTTGCCFCFGSVPSLFSGVISPLISSSILEIYRLGEFIFQCPIFLPFHTVHGVLKTRILKWFVIPFPSGPRFIRTLHHDWSIWVVLHSIHSFIELNRLWSMWSVWLVFCDCGFHSLCPLMDKDKRLIEASWWEGLMKGDTGYCSDGWSHAQ